MNNLINEPLMAYSKPLVEAVEICLDSFSLLAESFGFPNGVDDGEMEI